MHKVLTFSWSLLKSSLLLVLLMLSMLLLDKVIVIEESLIYLVIFRLALYTTILIGLPWYINKKLSVDQESLIIDEKQKKQLFKIRLYLAGLFVFVEVLMMFRGVWL